MPDTYPFWLGGVAASMAACCTHPLDLTKVRMQTLDSSHVAHPSALTVIRTSIYKDGVRSLYTGLSASLMRQMSYSLVRLGTYEELKRRMSEDGRFTTGKLLMATGIAGGVGGLAGNPADIILVRMTSDSTRPPEKRYAYPNAFSGLVSLVREEGIQGLARGLTTNMTRAVLMNISQVGSYDYFKTSLLKGPVVGYQLQDNLVLHILSSTLAGTVATTVCSPADVLRSRVMSSSSNATVMQVLKDSLREESVRFLFKGWLPAWMRLAPNTVLLFVFLEQLKKGWRAL